jgi:hypothetical protein
VLDAPLPREGLDHVAAQRVHPNLGGLVELHARVRVGALDAQPLEAQPAARDRDALEAHVVHDGVERLAHAGRGVGGLEGLQEAEVALFVLDELELSAHQVRVREAQDSFAQGHEVDGEGDALTADDGPPLRVTQHHVAHDDLVEPHVVDAPDHQGAVDLRGHPVGQPAPGHAVPERQVQVVEHAHQEQQHQQHQPQQHVADASCDAARHQKASPMVRWMAPGKRTKPRLM